MRTPKENLTGKIAEALSVSQQALNIPDTDNYVGLAHTLFAVEDLYGIKIGEIDGEVCLRLDKSKRQGYIAMLDFFTAWQEQAALLKNGEITVEKYNNWRYNYPNGERK